MGRHFPQLLIDALRAAQNVAVLTGAGVSAESGLPTFREAQTGLWAQYKPEELATPGAFRRDPKLVWEWYAWRRELVRKAQPNPAHVALARMGALVPQLTLITQNVDRLHQRAGSQNVIELHGDAVTVRCFDRGHHVETWDEAHDGPPPCPICGSPLRPNVVWFGELLPEAALSAAIDAAQSCTVFLSIGTSGVVYPAAALPEQALKDGALVTLINLDNPEGVRGSLITINGKAGEVLPELVEAVWGPQT